MSQRIGGVPAECRPGRTRRTIPVATWAMSVLALVVGLLVPGLPAASSGPCDEAGTNRWVATDGGIWSNPANWSLLAIPNDTDNVCIDAPAQTVLLDSAAQVSSVEVRAGSTLTVTGTLGYSAPSRVHAGATLRVSGVLIGADRMDIAGTLVWAGTPTAPAVLTSRQCGVGLSCASATTTPARIVVTDTGLVQVLGGPAMLADQVVLQVHGTMRLVGGATVAADNGTGLELRPRTSSVGFGRLDIAGDGGWTSGRATAGFDTATIANAGVIEKSAGSGAGVLQARYARTAPSGTITVRSGALAVPDTFTEPVTVGPGQRYGFGSCPGGCAAIGADPGRPQAAQVTVPASDLSGAAMIVYRSGVGPVGSIGSPVQISASGLSATVFSPAVLELRYDASLLAGATASTIEIRRAADGAPTFSGVPPCQATGTPPPGHISCVDRRGLAMSSRMLPDGDALMVVRTIGFSRWVARR